MFFFTGDNLVLLQLRCLELGQLYFGRRRRGGGHGQASQPVRPALSPASLPASQPSTQTKREQMF